MLMMIEDKKSEEREKIEKNILSDMKILDKIEKKISREKEEEKKVQDRIKAAMESLEEKKIALGGYQAIYQEVEKNLFDTKRFKLELPEIYETYTSRKTVQTFKFGLAPKK